MQVFFFPLFRKPRQKTSQIEPTAVHQDRNRVDNMQEAFVFMLVQVNAFK